MHRQVDRASETSSSAAEGMRRGEKGGYRRQTPSWKRQIITRIRRRKRIRCVCMRLPFVRFCVGAIRRKYTGGNVSAYMHCMNACRHPQKADTYVTYTRALFGVFTAKKSCIWPGSNPWLAAVVEAE